MIGSGTAPPVVAGGTEWWPGCEEISRDLFTDAFESSQTEGKARIEQILDAVKTKDFDRLASYHLVGPKFTKFDDVEPLERQDAQTSMRLEAEQFAGMESFHGRFEDVKIDVFGPVAIMTGIFVWDCTIEGDALSGRTRSTMVFVTRDEQWLITHEHHSPFPASR